MDPLAALFSSLLPPEIDLRDKADDLRHKIIIKMAATVKTIPPMTADKMMISGKLSEILKIRGLKVYSCTNVFTKSRSLHSAIKITEEINKHPKNCF